jgi:hypothetical protein
VVTTTRDRKKRKMGIEKEREKKRKKKKMGTSGGEVRKCILYTYVFIYLSMHTGCPQGDNSGHYVFLTYCRY